MLSVRKIDNFHTYLTELLLQSIPALATIPVITHKHFIELQVFTSRKFIHMGLRHNLVDTFDILDNSHSLQKWHYRVFGFPAVRQLVRSDPHNQVVTLRLCPLKQVQVPYVKKVKNTRRVTYYLHAHSKCKKHPERPVSKPSYLIR